MYIKGTNDIIDSERLGKRGMSLTFHNVRQILTDTPGIILDVPAKVSSVRLNPPLIKQSRVTA